MKNLSLPSIQSIEEFESNKKIAETLISLGFKKSVIPYVKIPSLESGYSMGEIVKVYCNKTLVMQFDNTRKYSGKFKGRETYGLIVVNLSKKSIKEWSKLCDKLYYAEFYSSNNRFRYREDARLKEMEIISHYLSYHHVESQVPSIREDYEKAKASYNEAITMDYKNVSTYVHPVKIDILNLFKSSISLNESRIKKLSVE